MNFIRIGDKLVNPVKIDETVRRVLHMRSEGMSQQEVAIKMQIDRSFISRLEALGSVRRGGRIGLLAFPVANKEELISLVNEYGIEQYLILNDAERWKFVKQSSGLDFFNYAITLIESFRQCDTVIIFCSAKWNRLAEALLDNQVIIREIGLSPIKEDVYIDLQEVKSILAHLR